MIFGGSSQVDFAQLWGAATPPAVTVATIAIGMLALWALQAVRF